MSNSLSLRLDLGKENSFSCSLIHRRVLEKKTKSEFEKNKSIQVTVIWVEHAYAVQNENAINVPLKLEPQVSHMNQLKKMIAAVVVHGQLDNM